ncbi:transposase family protein [Amycolatopsis sp. cmx-4-61]|uniref:transposase family protein n=1 Tax=Amycolatopsis sp. cmx-4-61 TaxID=2790937 RepID=UPI00397DF1C8
MSGEQPRPHPIKFRSGAQCPACGTWSARVHGNYTRSVHDLPTAGRRTVLTVRVRRWSAGRSTVRVGLSQSRFQA